MRSRLRGLTLDRSRILRRAHWLVFAAAFVVYCATLYPGVGGRFQYGDAAKWQYIGSILGISHPPGSPLYVLVTFVWTHLPIPFAPTVGGRVLVFSAACGAGAIALVYSACRRLGARAAAAALGSGALAITPAMWTFSTEAELYAPLALAWAFVVHRVLVWHERRRLGDYALACLGYALAFGNHYLMITLLPALAFWILATDWRYALRPRTLAIALGAIALGLLPFVWLWLHIPYAKYSEFPGVRTWPAVRDFLLVRQYSGGMFSGGLSLKRTIWATVFTGEQLGPAPLIVLALGAFAAIRVSAKRFGFVLLAALGPFIFLLGYRDGDELGGVVPVLIPLALLVSLGAELILHRLPSALWRAVGAVALLGLFSFRAVRTAETFAAHDPLMNLTHDTDLAKSYAWNVVCIARRAEVGTIIVPPYQDYGTRQILFNLEFTNPDVKSRDLSFRYLVPPPADWPWAQRQWEPNTGEPRVVYLFLREQTTTLRAAGYVIEERPLAELDGCAASPEMKYFRAVPSS